MSDKQNKIQEVVGNILTLLELDTDQFDVAHQDSKVTVQISLPEDQSGIFIGHRGETVSSLQLLLSLIISQRLGDWHRVHVNVGDYQERRRDAILDKTDLAVEKALLAGQEIVLPNLNAYERQIVHSHLTDHPDVFTESRGEEPFRQLYIVPRSMA